MRVLGKVERKLLALLGVRVRAVEGDVARSTLPRFATPAEGLAIEFPRQITNPERMSIGSDVKLGPNSVLKANVRYPGGWLAHPDGDHVEQSFDPRIVIGDRVTATAALHVAAFESVTIEDDVLFASNVFIADGTHSVRRGDVPYKYQGIDRVAPITIGRGAWIGQNVVVMPGVRIGAFAVVGANAVVTRDVPDSSIAVGSPARVVRRWDAAAESWMAVAGGASEP